jgi:FkbM family methyltransferase
LLSRAWQAGLPRGHRNDFRTDGNSFYRFSVIRKFIERNHESAIATIVDIGANIGNTLLLMHAYFPKAQIVGYEPVPDYFAMAAERTRSIEQISVRNAAVTAQHLFYDDLGLQPRPCQMTMSLFKGVPDSGKGWRGGSRVVPNDDVIAISPAQAFPGYQRTEQPIEFLTLAGLVEQESIGDIDLLKLDCEGCEHSVLGSADPECLRRIRFITGEYHGLLRFYEVMQKKLFLTHKVALDGTVAQGAFFAERRDGERDGVLLHRTAGKRVGPAPGHLIEWNPFAHNGSFLTRRRGLREPRASALLAERLGTVAAKIFPRQRRSHETGQ